MFHQLDLNAPDLFDERDCLPVIPAKAGIHPNAGECKRTRWIPAFAGMTGERLLMY
jgi:hypothetical protein